MVDSAIGILAKLFLCGTEIILDVVPRLYYIDFREVRSRSHIQGYSKWISLVLF